jgi:AcrR family transcriptional regulator
VAGVATGRRTSAGERRDARRADLAATLLGPLDATLREVGGYEHVHLGGLLERAGVARSTFYYAFDGKADLQLAIAQDLVELVFEPGLRLLDGAGVVGVHEIALGAAQLADGLNRYPHVCSAFLPGLGHAWLAPELEGRIDDVRRRFERSIAAQVEAGTTRPGLDPGPTAAWLVGMLLHGTGRLLAAAGPVARRRNATAMAEIAWLALYGRGLDAPR